MRQMCMKGQFNLFSYAPVKKRRPCEYSFDRYIGQLVRDRHGVHKIAEIKEFYTIYEDGMVGSPHDMSPVDEVEYLESINAEIEYCEHLAKNGSNKTIAENNLKILYEIKRRNDLLTR